MAQYNFADPNQAQEYRTKAINAGLSPAGVESYIRQQQQSQLDQSKLGLDIQKQEVEKLKLQKDVLDLGKDDSGLGDLSEFQRKVVNARLAGEQALSFLDEGLNTGPIATRLGELGEIVGRTGKGTEYRSALNLAAAQLFNALAGTAQSPAELKRLEKLIPKATEQESTARQKLQTLMGMLDTQAEAYGVDLSGALEGIRPTTSAPGMDLSGPAQEPVAPAINAKGEIANPGDLVVNDATGEMSLYGNTQQKGTLFKKSKQGGEVDNALIKFLADSEFLPIAGSIAGAFAGAGLASVGTGAAGAVAGKAMQQGLREMIDPERQELSDMAQAVVTEGVVDAIIGGVTFGVGVGAVKGLKLVLGKTPKELAEEGVEQIAKKGFKDKVVRGMTQKGLGVTSNQAVSYSKDFGGDLVGEIVGKEYGNIAEAARISQAEGIDAVKKLGSLLEGKTAKTSEVVELLEKTKESFMNKTGVAKTGEFVNIDGGFVEKTIPKGTAAPNYLKGVEKVDGWISFVLSHGDEISASDLNKVKQGLQESFPAGAGTLKGSTDVITSASTEVRKFIEKFHPEIKNTNKEIFFNSLVNESALKKLNNEQLKSMLQFSDLVVGSVNPVLLVSKKAVDVFANNFDDLAKANMINHALETAATAGNRLGVRNILRLANRLGISFEAAPSALVRATRGAVAGVGASAVTTQTQPGMEVSSIPGMTPEELVQTPLYK